MQHSESIEYPLTKQFFNETVKPTVDEYLNETENIRRGRLAAIVIYHLEDYWRADTNQKIHDELQTKTFIQGNASHSSADIIRDLANASKHAELTHKKETPPTLTHANQIKQDMIGAFGTAPIGTLAFGTIRPVGVSVVLDDEQRFSLSYVIQQMMDVWRELLKITPQQ